EVTLTPLESSGEEVTDSEENKAGSTANGRDAVGETGSSEDSNGTSEASGKTGGTGNTDEETDSEDNTGGSEYSSGNSESNDKTRSGETANDSSGTADESSNQNEKASEDGDSETIQNEGDQNSSDENGEEADREGTVVSPLGDVYDPYSDDGYDNFTFYIGKALDGGGGWYNEEEPYWGLSGDLTYSIEEGSLPPGISLNNIKKGTTVYHHGSETTYEHDAYEFAGTPTHLGKWYFTLLVTGSEGGKVHDEKSITIKGNISIKDWDPPANPGFRTGYQWKPNVRFDNDGHYGSVKSVQGPYFRLSSGSLPKGLKVDKEKGVVGTPTDKTEIDKVFTFGLVAYETSTYTDENGNVTEGKAESEEEKFTFTLGGQYDETIWTVSENYPKLSSTLVGATNVTYEFTAVPNKDYSPNAGEDGILIRGNEGWLTTSNGVSDVKIGAESLDESKDYTVEKKNGLFTLKFTGKQTITSQNGISFKVTGVTNPENSYKSLVSGTITGADRAVNDSEGKINYWHTGGYWKKSILGVHAKVIVKDLENISPLQFYLSIKGSGGGSIFLGSPDSAESIYEFSASELGETYHAELEVYDSIGNHRTYTSDEQEVPSTPGGSDTGEYTFTIGNLEDINLHKYTIKVKQEDVSVVLKKSGSYFTLYDMDGAEKVVLFDALDSRYMKAEGHTENIEVKKKYDLDKGTVEVSGSEIQVSFGELSVIGSDTVALSGRVKAGADSPLAGINSGGFVPGAIVTVSQTIKDYTLSVRTETDEYGSFEIKGQLVDGYKATINISKRGFETYSKTGIDIPGTGQDISLAASGGVISVSVNAAIPDESGTIRVKDSSSEVLSDVLVSWENYNQALLNLPKDCNTGTYTIQLEYQGMKVGDPVSVTLVSGKGSATITTDGFGKLDLNNITTDKYTSYFKGWIYDNSEKYVKSIGTGFGYDTFLPVGNYKLILINGSCPIFPESSPNTFYSYSDMINKIDGYVYGEDDYIKTSIEIQKDKTTALEDSVVVPSLLKNESFRKSTVQVPDTAVYGDTFKVTGTVKSEDGSRPDYLEIFANHANMVNGITVNGKSLPMTEIYRGELLGGYGWVIRADVSDIAPPFNYTAYIGNTREYYNYLSNTGGYPTVATTVLLSSTDSTEKICSIGGGMTVLTPAISFQSPSRVSGSLLDFSGTGTPNESIMILDNGDLAATVKADDSGRYWGTIELDTDYYQHNIYAVQEITANGTKSNIGDSKLVYYCPDEASLKSLQVNDADISLIGGENAYYPDVFNNGSKKWTAQILNPHMLETLTIPCAGGSCTAKVFFRVKTLGGSKLFPAVTENNGFFTSDAINFGEDYPISVKVIYSSKMGDYTGKGTL
ncbi:MAG: hypothetical protein K5989_10550, partial [Lachnospiraceae bacterium]|nr:hypothetical protein [Lachnospiraceae bacterium]